MWTKQEITEHNARVEAFRAEHHPLIDAMSDALCRRIYMRWTAPGEDMNAEKLALEFKDELQGTWPDSHGIGIGIKMLHVVLERLDKYDADFRPRPEPVLMEKNFHGGRIWYLPAEGRCRVEYDGRHETFRPDWNPRFGLDVVDQETALEILARLKGSISEAARIRDC
ncbi:hypothetical protein [Rhizobium leguminosarum]|uniref:hypothetical protein n=1 Tax=Rhizobium leguminosarum TaxID=384 RepID=UPI002E1176C1|nr:hypothetical protein U8Q02_39355 [Rhizobium leguminosarum]